MSRGGNRAGRAELGRANSGPGQNRARPKLARFFRAKILTSQPALKTGPVEPNSLFKVKKNSGGPGHIGLGHTEPGQIWPGFFRANNLMAWPDPNFGLTGLAHQVGPILPPLRVSIDNTEFHRIFRVWRRKASERSSTFSLRFTAIGGSVSVRPRLKIGVLVEGNAWTLKSRFFVEDSSGSSGRPWVSGLWDSKKFRLHSKR